MDETQDHFYYLVNQLKVVVFPVSMLQRHNIT